MEREKRKTKAPEGYVIPKICYPRVKKKKCKKKMPIRAQYQVIPAPVKFTCIPNFFLLYADIGLRIYQGTLQADTRIFNQYLDIHKVEIFKEQGFRKISLTVEKKFQIQCPAWQNLVEGLLESESNELREWGTRIKDFSLSHEEAYRALARKEVIINGRNERELLELTKETERKVSRFLKEYPCIYFTCATERKSSKITDMCFNEQFLNELGYTLESFATTVLHDGFPRLMPDNNACTSKILVDNYYSLGKEGAESPEIISDLLMKNGYLKRVRYKSIHLPTYRNRVYNVTGIVIILGRENSVIKDESKKIGEWNKEFLKKIICKERQMDNFMKKFYESTLTLPHLSNQKICRIRELNLVKDKEEEEWLYENQEEEWVEKKEEEEH